MTRKVGIIIGSDNLTEQVFLGGAPAPLDLRGNLELFELLQVGGIQPVPMCISPVYFDQPRRWRVSELDVIVNAISEPDLNPETLNIAELVLRDGPQILNHPTDVRETRRDRMMQSLAGIASVDAPKTVRLENPGAEAALVEIRRRNMSYPILVRQAGRHGGSFIGRPDDDQAVSRITWPSSPCYLSEYREYQGDDGLYRKSRFFFFGNAILWRHQLVSDSWNVHMSARDDYMGDHPQAILNERKALSAGIKSLPEVTRKVLRAIRRRVSVAIFGLDCAILSDGSVLVFEANPNMSFFPFHDDPRFEYQRRLIQRAADSLSRLLTRSSGSGGFRH